MFSFADKYCTATNEARKSIRNHVEKNFKPVKESKDYKCKPFNEYLNICDDFKTNLVWLSVFIPTIEGIGMRLPVNYRQVTQWNFSKE